jgi:7-cyano-7-deazaguanine synthase
MTTELIPRAVILLSGGLDSATTLAVARSAGYECHALSFDYGQRHRCELTAAAAVAAQLHAASHRVFSLDLAQFGGSALTDLSIAVPETMAKGIPITYVPARNTVFLAIALALAEVLEARAIYLGVNAVDYSGYPDCRPEFIRAFDQLANLATRAAVEGQRMVIEAPLIHLSKGEIIRLGSQLGVDYSLTISCYNPSPEGAACGRCDSCRLRAAGFIAANMADPTCYQLTDT